MTLLDPFGAALSLTTVVLLIHASRWGWLTSTAAVLVNGALYLQKGFFGHVFSEVFYLITNAYAWFTWGSQHQRNVKPIQRLTWSYLRKLLLLLLPFTLLLALFLRQTACPVPIWESANTSGRLLAHWLGCQKILENWLVWFVVDVSVFWLHWISDIPFHAGVHGFYTIMAIIGFAKWLKLYRQTKKKKAA